MEINGGGSAHFSADQLKHIEKLIEERVTHQVQEKVKHIEEKFQEEISKLQAVIKK